MPMDRNYLKPLSSKESIVTLSGVSSSGESLGSSCPTGITTKLKSLHPSHVLAVCLQILEIPFVTRQVYKRYKLKKNFNNNANKKQNSGQTKNNRFKFIFKI